MTEVNEAKDWLFILFHMVVSEHLPDPSMVMADCISVIVIRVIGQVEAWENSISTLI